MFTTLIVQPIFNVLVLIYGLLPGHNFGLAIIIFTVLVRWAMFPMLKKQLRNTVAMRALQPELKKIKQAAAGNRQKESIMTMELYKERGVSPFSSIGLLIIQIPLFLALYLGLKRIVDNPQNIVDFSYSWVQDLGWLKELARDIGQFDNTLFGVVDLSRSALSNAGGIYWPAMIIVILSSVVQWLQIKQTMPNDKNARGLRRILKEANTGKQADNTEVNAAVGRSMSYVFPVLIFVLTVNFAAALSLYWFVSGAVAYLQQSYLLKQDEYDLEKIAAKKSSTSSRVVEEKPKKVKSKAKTSGPKKNRKKRR